MLEYVEKITHAATKPQLVVIWLHGLGADCNDFLPIVSELKLTQCVKFIFPNAPMIPVTINNGFVMRAWYDILTFDAIYEKVDQMGIEQSCQQINQLIDEQIKLGFNSQQIILAGFSQGGVISYVTGIKSQHKLGGIIGLSCYLPFKNIDEHYPNNKITPILACHGKQDPVVPYQAGLTAYQAFKDAGYNISWHEYVMEHSVCLDEIYDIAQWLNLIMKDKKC